MNPELKQVRPKSSDNCLNSCAKSVKGRIANSENRSLVLGTTTVLHNAMGGARNKAGIVRYSDTTNDKESLTNLSTSV